MRGVGASGRRRCYPTPSTRVLRGPGGTIAARASTNVARRPGREPSPARCRTRILDVDRMGRERHDPRAAGETPSAVLVEGARLIILRERPQARLSNIGLAKPIQSEVVKCASDASTPRLWHHVQGLQDSVTNRDDSDCVVALKRKVRLAFRVGERGDPVCADRFSRELVEVWRKDVLEAGDRRSARYREAQLNVLRRRAHNPHVRRKYCEPRSGT